MNPVLILTRNNLDLTKRCVESVRNQDVETDLLVVDNGSEDDTDFWLREEGIGAMFLDSNKGVSYGWNIGLSYWFGERNAPYVLVINNDTILPRWFLRELAAYGMLYNLEPFVTGVATNDMRVLAEPPGVCPPSPHPDFSAFLIGHSVWEKVGPFDERMKLYAQDCAFHIEAHRRGVKLWKVNVPYYHVNSQTLQRADPKERHAIQEQANKDRMAFKALYGCLPGTPEYNDLFKEPCGQAKA
jgi:GT2 family glycosyltransferase